MRTIHLTPIAPHVDAVVSRQSVAIHGSAEWRFAMNSLSILAQRTNQRTSGSESKFALLRELAS
jgi:hypothetical protein